MLAIPSPSQSSIMLVSVGAGIPVPRAGILLAIIGLGADGRGLGEPI